MENANCKTDYYIGTKLIEAIPMDNITFAKEKYGEEKLGNEKQEGYKVVYEDGYTSWSPVDVFERAYKKLNIFDTDNMTELESDLITCDNTYIQHDKISFNAPHNYIIRDSENDNILAGIHFQEGPLKENKKNGIFHEDLIAICINRLEHFQNSEFACIENEKAIEKLQESLMWLRKRTLNRQKRNVLGTNIV